DVGGRDVQEMNRGKRAFAAAQQRQRAHEYRLGGPHGQPPDARLVSPILGGIQSAVCLRVATRDDDALPRGAVPPYFARIIGSVDTLRRVDRALGSPPASSLSIYFVVGS